MASSLFPLTTGDFRLVIAPHAGTQLLIEIAARLAVSGSVRILDCGNRSNVYPIAKAIRRLTADVDSCLERILISRAFTAYEVVTMLQQESPSSPIIVVDMLSMFFDESISLVESQRLLDLAIMEIKRFCQVTPVIVTVNQKLSIDSTRFSLLDNLMMSTKLIFRLESSLQPKPTLSQATLF